MAINAVPLEQSGSPAQPDTGPDPNPQVPAGRLPQPVPLGQPQAVAAPGQAVVVQPAPDQTVAVQHHPAPVVVDAPTGPEHLPAQPEVRVYSHSTFFYWWPVWVTGYIMALVTFMGGHPVQIGDTTVIFHYSKNLGVIFTLTFFLVILITNVTLRGLSSLVVILGAAFLVLLLAYFQLWDDVLHWLGKVWIYMNLGFYIFFSTLVLLVWAFSVFVYDRLSYWKVRPGQMTHEAVIGGAQKSYDTRGMVFEKHRQDLFRHWVIGLGSGDIQISTTGAKRETVYVPNVLFVDTKINEIQKMIAMKPTEFSQPVA